MAQHWLAGGKTADVLVILQFVFYQDENDDVWKWQFGGRIPYSLTQL